jgi:hypothetical protein
MEVFQAIITVLRFILGLIGLFIIGVIYFYPTIVAKRADHPNIGGIKALNLLLGWTFLGWVIAMVWAKSYQPKLANPANAVFNTKTCPKCAEDVKSAALICRFCGHEFG